VGEADWTDGDGSLPWFRRRGHGSSVGRGRKRRKARAVCSKNHGVHGEEFDLGLWLVASRAPVDGEHVSGKVGCGEVVDDDGEFVWKGSEGGGFYRGVCTEKSEKGVSVQS